MGNFVFRPSLKHEWAEPIGVPIDAPPVKTLLTMTPAERAEMVRLYGPMSAGTKKLIRVQEAHARDEARRAKRRKGAVK